MAKKELLSLTRIHPFPVAVRAKAEAAVPAGTAALAAAALTKVIAAKQAALTALAEAPPALLQQ